LRVSVVILSRVLRPLREGLGRLQKTERRCCGESRENRPRIGEAKVAVDYFRKHRSEVCRDGQVASFVPLLRREPRPAAVDLSAADATTDDHHGVAMSVMGATVLVLHPGAAT